MLADISMIHCHIGTDAIALPFAVNIIVKNIICMNIKHKE
jgi:hypothetical protein